MSDLKFKLSRHSKPTSYYEHDNRDERVVNFNNGSGGKSGRRRRKNQLRHANARSTSNDDVQMADDSEPSRKSRFVPYEARGGASLSRNWKKNRNRNRSKNNNGFNQRNERNSRSNHNWFRIIIPHVGNLEKNTILKTLHDEAQTQFVAYNFNFDGNCAKFYVEGADTAMSVARLNGKISLPNGNKMIIKSNQSLPAEVRINDKVLELVKGIMSKRFNLATFTLDLSNFVNDIDLKNEGLYMPLSRAYVFQCVIKIIEENVPNLHALNLCDNKLTAEQLRSMSSKLKTVKILLLDGNYLRSLSDLDLIRDLPLEEISLTRNPLSENKKDEAAFVSTVRQKFAKLVRLDGQELPPAYGFDVESEVVLPSSQGNFFTNEIVRELVPQFLEQYFSVYDSGDRQNLIAAYHDNALFSLSAVAYLKSSGNQNMNQFQIYSGENRNLLRVNDSKRREKLLRRGKFEIISLLRDLPKTQHDPMSFSIDVPHHLPSLITISCSGVFKEPETKNPPIRAFKRVFLLVPQGAGYCIINEMLFVTQATMEQAKIAFKPPAQTPAPSPVPTGSNAGTAEQQQMVMAFSQRSGMNLDWSLKCLRDNDWDFEKSAVAFQTNLGQIPAEAFIKS